MAYIPPFRRGKRPRVKHSGDSTPYVDREMLITSAPIYDGVTIFGEATVLRRKKRRAPNTEQGWFQTVLLFNVKFDGITIEHIWVGSNDHLQSIELDTRIKFKARGYSYTRRDGTISLGLRKIHQVSLASPGQLKWARTDTELSRSTDTSSRSRDMKYTEFNGPHIKDRGREMAGDRIDSMLRSGDFVPMHIADSFVPPIFIPRPLQPTPAVYFHCR